MTAQAMADLTVVTPRILRTRADLRAVVAGWRAAGERVGVVPTMGALHKGHLALAERAKAECDRVITTLFVNPKQFNNASDLENYPRTEDSDCALLAPLGVDVLYAPDVDQMYPAGFATTVSVAGLTDVLCGAHRPGHFDGVATIVTKLLTQTAADRAYFGEKDFQQLQVVRRLVTDLDLPVEVVGCPTVREADGLAMSSRNRRLTDAGRAVAPALLDQMQAMAQGLRAGSAMAELRAKAEQHLLAAGFERVEYLDLRGVEDLVARERLDGACRLFVAAWLDDVRLIDNIAV